LKLASDRILLRTRLASQSPGTDAYNTTARNLAELNSVVIRISQIIDGIRATNINQFLNHDITIANQVYMIVTDIFFRNVPVNIPINNGDSLLMAYCKKDPTPLNIHLALALINNHANIHYRNPRDPTDSTGKSALDVIRDKAGWERVKDRLLYKGAT